MTEPDLNSPPIGFSPQTPSRPQRRWLRFGLRSLLVLIAVLAIPLAWWVNGIRRQRQAVAAIRAVYPNAHIFTFNWGNHHVVDPHWLARAIAWVDDRIPADYLHSVWSVYIEPDSPPERPPNFTSVMDAIKSFDHLRQFHIYNSIQDADVIGLDRLTQLQVLAISGPSPDLTDAGLATLLNILSLRDLTIGDCAATDSWVVRLKALPHLKKLNLGDSEILVTGKSRMRITGAGMAGLPQLTELGLSSPCLTHDGLAQLRPLREIEALDLGGPLTPSDLWNLQAMSKLNVLVLNNTELHGQGLEALAKLPSLVNLFFYHELINDSHLPNILAIPTLVQLRLLDTDVTPDGALAFQNAHPRMPASSDEFTVSVRPLRPNNLVRLRPPATLADPTPPHLGAKP